ncbi:hypothetical protein Taro_013124 [Colocasia esculenta]|uniref:Uncharacterized protein n=1 Tax=Colocasia esculenta TaxID=4460 RepID=A0A843UFD0_COLES|nr:hypothetical protein [Colocasia esculenta]
MDSDPNPPAAADAPIDQDSDSPTADAVEEQMLSSLTLDDAEEPAGNGSLHADLQQVGASEIVIEEPPRGRDPAEGAVLGASGEAGEPSSVGGVMWRESWEQDGEEPSSPSSSGYAGERGSSGGSSGNDEIEEMNGPAAGKGEAVDGAVWASGKKHVDEVRTVIFGDGAETTKPMNPFEAHLANVRSCSRPPDLTCKARRVGSAGRRSDAQGSR